MATQERNGLVVTYLRYIFFFCGEQKMYEPSTRWNRMDMVLYLCKWRWAEFVNIMSWCCPVKFLGFREFSIISNMKTVCFFKLWWSCWRTMHSGRVKPLHLKTCSLLWSSSSLAYLLYPIIYCFKFWSLFFSHDGCTYFSFCSCYIYRLYTAW